MEGHNIDVIVAELGVKVKTLEGLAEQSREDRHALQCEINKLSLSNERLCTVLESLEKKMCPEPGACIAVKAELDAIKGFQNRLVGGAIVVSTISAVLGVVGGWALALWMHYHGNSDAASVITGSVEHSSSATNHTLFAENVRH